MPRLNLKKLLNEEQFHAASHVDGPLLILAGAGSGKTRVVTYRTVNLIGLGIPAKNILLVTFTNKASKEMKERITELAGDRKKIKGLTVSTFHSLCVRILQVEAEKLGFTKKFSIYDMADQKQVMFEALKELKVNIDEMPMEYIWGKISNAKNTLIFPEDYLAEKEEEQAVKVIYQKYQDTLKGYSAVDFDDLIMLTVKLFKENPDVLAKYQRKFKYIMVDEYQDTNKAQYQLCSLLSQAHKNIGVVGDDDQSIYSWRGADITNILNFEKDFPGSKVVRLEKNYRSTGNILNAANNVIAHNTDRKGKNLISVQGDGEKILTLEATDPWEEAEKIASELHTKRIYNQQRYRDVAVLFRTNSQSKPIEETFARMKIPYKTSSKYDLYDRKEVKDALAYLKIMNNKEDDLSLLRIINFPKRGIGSGTIKKAKEIALNGDIPLFDALQYGAEKSLFSIEASAEIVNFLTLLDNYKEALEGKEMASIYQDFLKQIGFLDEITRTTPDVKVAELKLQNIEQLISTIDNYAQKSKTPNLKNYLTKLALFFASQGNEEEDLEDNSVTLMTIHAAKGLEFPKVYIVGFEENTLPFVREEGDVVNVEEERRLTYVALTRAQIELTLCLCRERNKFSERKVCEPSRFLAEIPDQYIQRSYGDNVFQVDKKTGQVEMSNEDMAELSFSHINALFGSDSEDELEISETEKE